MTARQAVVTAAAATPVAEHAALLAASPFTSEDDRPFLLPDLPFLLAPFLLEPDLPRPSMPSPEPPLLPPLFPLLPPLLPPPPKMMLLLLFPAVGSTTVLALGSAMLGLVGVTTTETGVSTGAAGTCTGAVTGESTGAALGCATAAVGDVGVAIDPASDSTGAWTGGNNIEGSQEMGGKVVDGWTGVDAETATGAERGDATL